VDAYRRVNLRLDIERLLQRDVLCVVGMLVVCTVAFVVAVLLLSRRDRDEELTARREAGASTPALQCTGATARICIYEVPPSLFAAEDAKRADLRRRGIRPATSPEGDTFRFRAAGRDVTVVYAVTSGGEIVGNQRLPAGITLATVTLAQRQRRPDEESPGGARPSAAPRLGHRASRVGSQDRALRALDRRAAPWRRPQLPAIAYDGTARVTIRSASRRELRVHVCGAWGPSSPASRRGPGASRGDGASSVGCRDASCSRSAA